MGVNKLLDFYHRGKILISVTELPEQLCLNLRTRARLSRDPRARDVAKNGRILSNWWSVGQRGHSWNGILYMPATTTINQPLPLRI